MSAILLYVYKLELPRSSIASFRVGSRLVPSSIAFQLKPNLLHVDDDSS